MIQKHAAGATIAAGPITFLNGPIADLTVDSARKKIKMQRNTATDHTEKATYIPNSAVIGLRNDEFMPTSIRRNILTSKCLKKSGSLRGLAQQCRRTKPLPDIPSDRRSICHHPAFLPPY